MNLPSSFDHVWRWRPIYRKGELCRVLVRGTKNSVLVEFEDGFRVCTSRWAVRPLKPGEPIRHSAQETFE